MERADRIATSSFQTNLFQRKGYAAGTCAREVALERCYRGSASLSSVHGLPSQGSDGVVSGCKTGSMAADLISNKQHNNMWTEQHRIRSNPDLSLLPIQANPTLISIRPSTRTLTIAKHATHVIPNSLHRERHSTRDSRFYQTPHFHPRKKRIYGYHEHREKKKERVCKVAGKNAEVILYSHAFSFFFSFSFLS